MFVVRVLCIINVVYVSVIVNNLMFVQDLIIFVPTKYCINVSAEIAEVGAPIARILFCL